MVCFSFGPWAEGSHCDRSVPGPPVSRRVAAAARRSVKIIQVNPPNPAAGPKPSGRITAQMVADHAGVSLSAVSRTFTKGASVSKDTRRKVEQAAVELGYRPNRLARGLMTGRTELVGLAANTFSNPTFMQVFDLFTRRLQARGLRPLLANLAGERDAESAFDMMLQYQVDAVIIASSNPPEGFAQSCQAAGMPVVNVFGRKQAVDSVPVVTVDNIAGGRLAAEAMLARGIRRAAFMGGPASSVASQDRGEGFCGAFETGGGQVLARMFAGDYAYESGRRAALDLLGRNTGLQGLFCGDDIIALGALDVCRDRGLRVPEELSVIGFDNMDMAAWSPYQLTTIRQPIAEMVDAAISQIAARLEDAGQPLVSRIFPCELIERASLRPVP